MADRTVEELRDLTLAEGLRNARLQRNLSQRELAARVSLSPSMISQIEAGQSLPSVTTLYAIASELDISMDGLFGHSPTATTAVVPVAVATSSEMTSVGTNHLPAGPAAPSSPQRGPIVVRGDDRSRLRLDTGVTWERLASPDADALDIMEVTYDVGGMSSRDGTLTRHNSIEVVLLLSGRLDIQVAFDVHQLLPGDSIAFDSTIPHRLSNPGTDPAHAISVVLAH